MSKYNVKFSCGHEETVYLTGPYKERERKISYYEESGLCSECIKKSMIAKMESDGNVIEVKYSEYKNKYSHCKTVPDSYNSDTKTIKIVFDTKAEEERLRKIALSELRNELIKIAPAILSNSRFVSDIKNDGSVFYIIIDNVRHDLSDEEKNEIETFFENKRSISIAAREVLTMSYEDLEAKTYLGYTNYVFDFNEYIVDDSKAEVSTDEANEEENED